MASESYNCTAHDNDIYTIFYNSGLYTFHRHSIFYLLALDGGLKLGNVVSLYLIAVITSDVDMVSCTATSPVIVSTLTDTT